MVDKNKSGKSGHKETMIWTSSAKDYGRMKDGSRWDSGGIW